MHSSIVANHIPLSGKETRGRKRESREQSLKILTFQEMLDQDIEEEARKKRLTDGGNAEIALGACIHASVKPNFLGTTLTRRFRYSSIVRN